MTDQNLVEIDPLDDPDLRNDAYHGAVLLSDQIQYYIRRLSPPLLSNPKGQSISDLELKDCLDAASYKLRLGDEAHVGGEWVPISQHHPLVLPAHQVAVIKTHEIVNIPRFLIARWNLRVTWVYEGLLWTGGPQVDPGWKGELYCPIYNLAERQIVIPHKERVFTMDFTRTTPFHEDAELYGYKSKPHEYARKKTIQGHDVNRLRSAPFESLKQLSTLDSRVNSFNTFTFLVLAVVVAAIGVIASLSGGRSEALGEVVNGNSGTLVFAIVALVFGFSGLIVGISAMALRFGPMPQGRLRLTVLSIAGAASLGVGSGWAGRILALGIPKWSQLLGDLSAVVAGSMVICGLVILSVVWCRATKSEPRHWF